MPKILCDDKIPFLKGALEPHAEVVYLPGAKITRAEAKTADALIVRTRTECGADLLEGTSVRFVATATIGFDHIDTAYCDAKGITWTNAPGCNSASVAQYITAALLHLSQRLGIELKRKTLGVIGVGNVGSKVARNATALGMQVLLNDPPRFRRERSKRLLPLDELVTSSDIITLHVPLDRTGIDKTFHMVDKAFLGMVKEGVFLFNSSRGEVVDTEALKTSLTQGKLMGAVLDVWENEPEIDRRLLELAHLATPHIAGYSLDGKANGTSMCVQALGSFFDIEPLRSWRPADVPPPPDPVIAIDCDKKKTVDILHEAVKATYDIEAEDKRLRASPGTFEKQRGDYPFRREPPAYSIKLSNAKPGVTDNLASLGFRIEKTS